MLHYETVLPATLELLKRLMADSNIPAFRLVGGTALALQMGHRLSVDIDLFSDESFDEVALREYLVLNYGFKTEFISKETLKGEINGVQVDCIAHKYHWIRPCIEEDAIRLTSIEDLCAMKLNAVSNSGKRVKDFIDIAYLSTRFSLQQMLGFFEEKYGESSLLALKAITFFDDINCNEPVMLSSKHPFNWKSIAKRLQDMNQYQLKVFTARP